MFNTKILENLMVAFCFCITLALHLLIFNHYFSLQEGWWETYAYLVNKGEVINKDFYLAWTPLFVYINAFYQKIFGINFFAFACIGVVAAMIQVILLYAVLREFFSRVSSAVAAIFASLLWIVGGSYIAKDYHTYVFIIEFSTLLFLVKSIKNENSKKGIIYQILGILFLVLLFFIKQNVGLVLFASLFVSYAFISSNVKDYLKRIGFLLLFTIIFFASINFIMPFDPSSITDNDSKGSLWTIATRFIFEPLLFKNLIVAFTIFIFILVLKRYFDCICCIYDKTMMKIMHDVASPIRFAMVGAIFIVLGYFIIHFTSKHIYIGFSISIILFIITMVFIIKNAKIYKSKEYKFMALAITAIVYSGTLTSYALDMNTILLCLSFAFAYILNQNLRNFVRAIFLFWMLFIMALIFYSKLLNPYNWLENYQPSIFRADGEASYPQLKGIKMDKKISEILDFFNEYVGKKSKSDKDFYFFRWSKCLGDGKALDGVGNEDGF
ncbi:glycosyltransferase family 39 protein [uncultured Campylobacter sp.]|uniref:ArnT family glycosyltransferase n=1 Tax=uncultured Campylobacter sp. TaxID=218934 RepID=UPI0026039711|nr:glycosyltransferase family 39 protein [uncultured Campylobacter sp.]